MPYQDPTTVAILGRDRVVGQALELLLRGADYDARFLGEPVMDKLGELLDGVHILLLGPTLSADRRENLLDGLRGEPGTANIPVLELITPIGGSRNGHGRHVMWPCKTEELMHHIEEALCARDIPRTALKGRQATTGDLDSRAPQKPTIRDSTADSSGNPASGSPSSSRHR